MLVSRRFPILLRVAAVTLGGLLGGALRYVVTVGLSGPNEVLSATTSPWETFDWSLLAVNSIGVFLAVSLLFGWCGNRPSDDPLRLFATTGVLGGLTTYSSLCLNLVHMWQNSPGAALGGLSLSLTVAALATASGLYVVREGRHADL